MGTLVESGRLPEIFGWLGRHIWSQGSLHGTDELIRRATGEALSIPSGCANTSNNAIWK